jgi:hypothetical protein
VEYTPLNLVIHDWKFYTDNTLVKSIAPWAHINYVGWVPVLLAIFSLFFIRESQRKREMILLTAAAVLSIVFSSRAPYIPLKNWGLIEQLSNINVGASLAVQPLLLLAGISIQEILDHKWTRIVSLRSQQARILTRFLF